MTSWRNDGCVTNVTSSDTVICQCTHLTSFSVGKALPAQPSSTTGSTFPLWAIAVVVGGVVILALIVAIAVIVHRRSAKVSLRLAGCRRDVLQAKSTMEIEMTAQDAVVVGDLVHRGENIQSRDE